MKKQITAILLALFVIASLFAGCGGGATTPAASSTTSSEGSAPASSDSAEEAAPAESEGGGMSGNITFVAGSVEQQALTAVLEEYNGLGNDLTIDFVLADNVSDFESMMTTYIASNDFPDMYISQVGAVQQGYGRQGLLMPLNDTGVMDNLIDGDYGLISYDGTFYAFPMALSMSVLLANMDVFEQCGVSLDQFPNGYPESFPQLLDLLQQLKDGGCEAPFAMAGMDSSNVTAFGFQYIYQVIYGTNPNWYADILEGNEAWNGELYMEQFSAYEQLSAFFPADCLGVDNDTLLRRFVLGESAMYAQTAGSLASLREVDPEVNILLLPPCFTQDPADQTLIGGLDSGISILADAENPELCVDFLKCITSDAGSTAFSEITTNLPTTKVNSVVVDPAYDIVYPLAQNATLPTSAILSREWIAGIKEVMKTANQNWLAGEDAKTACDEIESQHKRLMEADPEWVAGFLADYVRK